MSVEIPLRCRDGTVRAHALIDEEDAVTIMRYRWSLDSHGYAHRGTMIGGRGGRSVVFLLHRQIMGLVRGDGMQVDHINGDRLDCRRENLRVCTAAENGQNVQRGHGASSYRGVSWHKLTGKWAARGKAGGRTHNLGLFDDELEAARVAAAFRAEHMPFSAEARPAVRS